MFLTQLLTAVVLAWALAGEARSQPVPTGGLKLWLRADSGVSLASGSVSRWSDQSGNGNHARQSSSGYRPVLVSNAANGKPAVKFDGVNDYLSFSLALNGLQGLSMVLVSSSTAYGYDGGAYGAYHAPLSWQETAAWGGVHLSPFPEYVRFRFGTGQASNIPSYARPASIGDRFSITTAVKNGSSESLFVDGAQVLAMGGKLPAIANTAGTGELGRGEYATAFPGSIAEILVYARALSDAERRQIEDYLSFKYFGNSVPPPINQPPAVSAGADQTITLPSPAALSGTATDDGLPGGSLTTTWSQVSGPAAAAIANPNSLATTVSFPAAGTYVFRLTASDGQLASADEATVTVTSSPQPLPIPTQNLRLWLRSDAGVTLNSAAVSKWADQSGNGSDATQLSLASQPTLVLNAINGQPAVRFDGVDDFMDFRLPQTLNGLTAMTIILAGAATQDVDGGPQGSANAPIFWNETAAWGSVHASPFPSIVRYRFGTGAANNMPWYVRNSTIGTGYSFTEVSKNGSSEYLYVNGGLVQTLSGALPAIANTADAATLGRGSAGTFFSGRLTEVLVYTRALAPAERDQVNQYLAAKYFGANPPPQPVNQPPTVSAGSAQTITLPASANLNGSAGDDGSPFGTLATTWSKASGPGTVTFGSAGSPVTTASFSAAGTYVLRLTASDGALSASSEVTITVQSGGGVPPGAIVISTGANIQSFVTNNPEGAQFYLRAGVYRMQSVTPKNGNRFTGEKGAILSGARLLTSFTRQGSYWIASGQTQGPGRQVGTCQPDYPRCAYPEDLFFDDKPLKHVSSLSSVVAGAWYFDYAGDRIYFADDPTGHTVETSVSSVAFSGSASGVVMEGLIIEKYATPAQSATVTAQSGGNWTVQGCELRYNHGAAIRPGNGAKILRNNIHHNGQLGIGGGGTTILVEGNEIAHNNYAGFAYDWEAGGTKFAFATDLTVRDNYVHDNAGPGLWTDINNMNTLYEGNRTSGNMVAGILHEISFKATIRNNTVENDGFRPEGSSIWYASGISIANSSDVEVYGNTVRNCVNGIGAMNTDRGSSSSGVPYLTKNLYVHDNTIVQTTGTAGGMVKSANFDDSVFTSWGNRWIRNTYTLGDLNAERFEWMNRSVNKAGWQSYGMDVDGVFQ